MTETYCRERWGKDSVVTGEVLAWSVLERCQALQKTRAVANSTADLTREAVVSRGENSCGSLESKLHPFIALALLVVDWPDVLTRTVGEGDDLGGRVDTTLIDVSIYVSDIICQPHLERPFIAIWR